MRRQQTTGESLVVPSHVKQMQMWVIRKGLEFYPIQDTPEKHRLKLINRMIQFNKLDLYYNAIVRDFLVTGGILWHLRQTEMGDYQILWYDKDHYRTYYAADGLSISRVTISYPYEDPQRMYIEATKERWIKLEITGRQIRVERFNQEPSLDEHPQQHLAPFASEVFENTLGFIPCVESPNNPVKPGGSGVSEFEPVENQIAAEDAIRCSMLRNISTFGNPTLVTSLPKERVYEQYDDLDAGRIAGNLQYSWAAQQGYQSERSRATWRNSMPAGILAKTKYGVGGWTSQPGHVVRIVGNVRDQDRFAYLQVEPISEDQWRFSSQYKEEIHEALGGIDPLGNFATFGELKSLHGKVASTADIKATSLWTYGLCKILSMAIQIEEQVYQVMAGEILSKHFKPLEITVDLIQQFYESGTAPSLPGIPPYGDRAIKWRHKGPVFEDSPDDKLQLSIVCRNLQELGVGSLEAMRYLFPDKTEKEIKALLTGVPFRYIQQTISSMSSLLSLQQQLYNIPDPQNPSLPLANRFDVSPILSYTLNNLMREISYGAEYEPDSSLSASAGNGSRLPDPAASTGSTSPAISPARPNGYPLAGISGQSSVGRYTGSTGWSVPGHRPDFQSSIPSPGSSLDAGSAAAFGSSILGSEYPALPGLPPDLAANPTLAAQLYPELFSGRTAGQPASTPGKTGRPSRSTRTR